MKLLLFYIAIVGPLLALILISKSIPRVWFVAGFVMYFFYNLILVHVKLKRKGYNVGIFAHLNPFSKRSQELFDKTFFEA